MRALCLTLGKWDNLKLGFFRSGLFPEPFYAINGRRCKLATTRPFDLDHPGSGYLISPKYITMTLGHYGIWSAFRHFPEDELLVLEDDAEFDVDWLPRYEEARRHLPNDWDMFYLGSCCTADKKLEEVGGGVFKGPGVFCTHAYMVRKKVLPTLLRTQATAWAPIDVQLILLSHPHLNVYTILPRIVQQRNMKLST